MLVFNKHYIKPIYIYFLDLLNLINYFFIKYNINNIILIKIYKKLIY